MRFNFARMFRYLWTSWWRRRSGVGTQGDLLTGRAAAARARFWTELRAGQREAEANASRPR